MRMRPTQRPHASDESGFTLLLTLGVMFVASLLMTAAFVASESDIQLTRNDVNAKKAYYAAQAGISDYAYHLNADFNYWTYCTGGAAATNKSLNLAGASPLSKVSVPGATEESYAIQLLPASTAPSNDQKCDPANPVATMIQATGINGGTFRIESTGYSGKEERTILATYAHTSFLNFLYYTKYETLDPNTYSPAKPQCAAFAYGSSPRPSECTSIEFVSTDNLKGPVYTEDTASICGTPTFGRGVEDNIEFKGGSSTPGGGCTNGANYLGTVVPPSEVQPVEPPPSNTSLKAIATAKYSGKTIIELEGEKMTVKTEGKTLSKIAFPSNGVIYVSNSSTLGCSETYTPYGSSYGYEGCGNVYVKGKYESSLTIGAENDVIVNGSITPPVTAGVPTTNAVLGLIANNFVRVYHPVSSGGGVVNNVNECNATNQNSTQDPNGWGTQENIEIYAAILAVNHSFIVDNFRCGSPMGNLNVYGAVAQIFRGTVGTHSGTTVVSGYSKNYSYDERLHVESPPYFLNPVTASWSARREVLAKNP
jgi:Tfp pilus assembly protein PilX